MKNRQIYKVIGIMSGTSLDGVDMAYCEFEHAAGAWSFQLIKSETISYPSHLLKQLQESTRYSALQLAALDVSLGRWFGKNVDDFIKNNQLKVDLIASHGHTVFHQIDKGITAQIGDGNFIAATTGKPVIYNFRALDVALGGQGAPLVPIGDKLLFSEYDYCLNLGGIANISFEKNNQRLAYDICPCNMVLNYIAGKVDLDFDKDGEIARKGMVIEPLLEALDALEFYSKPYPKSLGYEWVDEQVYPLLETYASSPENLMRTFAEHIVNKITDAIAADESLGKKLLITGGGAFNAYLIERMDKRLTPNVEICLPKKEIIDYKEAIVFGFLGVLRIRLEVNCLSSVTGASRNNCGGVISEGIIY